MVIQLQLCTILCNAQSKYIFKKQKKSSEEVFPLKFGAEDLSVTHDRMQSFSTRIVQGLP